MGVAAAPPSPMASRTKQKEEARARRLAEERSRAERERRNRRTRMLGGVLLGAAAVVAVAIAISSSGGNKTVAPTSAAARQQASTVGSLLTGIPQSGVTLGSPSAPVTVTEFGDLECSHCQDFALNAESQLIANDVRAGKVKLVYRSLETASGANPDQNIFPIQQAAAYAAGPQGKAWNYILLFYHEQGQEGTAYVTPSYLDGLARQIPGLNYSGWLTQSKNPTFASQVIADEQAARTQGFNSTPTIVIQGPKGQAQPIAGVVDYGTLEAAIKSVE
jgi:protein-disulfide isomerase